MSNEALGRRPRSRDDETLRLWSGLSVYESEAQARHTADAFPMIGAFLAQVRITDDDPVRLEKSLGAGHFTLWGEAALLLRLVTKVLPVEQREVG